MVNKPKNYTDIHMLSTKGIQRLAIHPNSNKRQKFQPKTILKTPMEPLEKDARDYVCRHNLDTLIDDMVVALVYNQPIDVKSFIVNQLKRRLKHGCEIGMQSKFVTFSMQVYGAWKNSMFIFGCWTFQVQVLLTQNK